MKTATWRNRLAVAAILGMALVPLSGAQKTSSTSTNVTTTVYDYSASGVQNLMRSDDANGSGQATYTTIAGHSGNTITSQIGPNGNWQLDLYNQSVRTLWITPNSAINSSQPAGPPAGYFWQNVEAYSKCFDQSGNNVTFPSVVNGSNNCSLGVDFYSTTTGKKYKLVMGPGVPSAICPSTGCPATGLATVTCNAVNSGNQCVSWTIAPNTSSANANVANLYYYNQKGTLVFVGQYINTYRIDVTNP